MADNLFLIKRGAKKIKSIKEEVLEKSRLMIAPNTSLTNDTLIFSKEGQWAKIKGSITFTAKGEDIEVMYSRTSEATSTAYLVGCIGLLIGLVLVIIPWYLYDQETKNFDATVQNIINLVQA